MTIKTYYLHGLHPTWIETRNISSERDRMPDDIFQSYLLSLVDTITQLYSDRVRLTVELHDKGQFIKKLNN